MYPSLHCPENHQVQSLNRSLMESCTKKSIENYMLHVGVSIIINTYKNVLCL